MSLQLILEGAPLTFQGTPMLLGTTTYTVCIERKAGGVSYVPSQSDYAIARQRYLEYRNDPSVAYVVLYTNDGSTGIKFLAVSGVPTAATPYDMIAVDAPYDPPAIDPNAAQDTSGSKGATSTKASFFSRNKWFIIGGGAAVAGITMITLARHH